MTCGGGERTPISSVGGMPVGDGPRWGREWKEELRRNWDAVVTIDVQGESLPYVDQFMDLDPVYNDVHGRPLLRLTFDFHRNDYLMYRWVAERAIEIAQAMNPSRTALTRGLTPFNLAPYQSTHITGGAIMGSSPDDSVVDRYGRVWDTPNVFVTGATVYPQNPGMNPTGTLCALAYYTAHGILNGEATG